MFEKIKNKYHEKKNQILVGSTAGTAGLVATSTTALASGAGVGSEVGQGVSDLMTIVTTMLTTITTNPILMMAFVASFIFVAINIVRRLK